MTVPTGILSACTREVAVSNWRIPVKLSHSPHFKCWTLLPSAGQKSTITFLTW
uniref:Uncharacterized protein n=1 Tax=Anguilla anguilla TaxID=7936 RepID=A0A0E9SKM7_ANGAN